MVKSQIGSQGRRKGSVLRVSKRIENRIAAPGGQRPGYKLAAPLGRRALFLAIFLGVITGLCGPAAADQAWIEDACPRQLGPDLWKECADRNLRALQAGLPDLTALAATDRAWIEDACPRGLGPDLWKECADRNLRALQAGLPELDEPDVEAKPELDQPDPASVDLADRTRAAAADGPLEAANDDPDPAPGLPAPAGGERWFCYTDEFSAVFGPEPELVLTRDAPTDRAFGEGRILIASVVHDAQFSIEGIDRRWDWSDGFDSISIDPGGNAAYYDFRRLKAGETSLERPTSLLWCNRG